MYQTKPDKMKRGQLYYADLEPALGSEQGSTRPVVLIQNNIGNEYSPTAIVAPITSQLKKGNQPTHVWIPAAHGIRKNSMVMAEQLRVIDKQRLGGYLGCLSGRTMKRIDKAIAISVGIPYREEKRSQSYVSYMKRKPADMVMTLCPTCLQYVMNMPDTIVRRVDPDQNKELCTYCNYREGYDYRIIHKTDRTKK